MSRRTKLRLGLTCLTLLVLSGPFAPHVQAQAPFKEEIGVVDRRGVFHPKARVTLDKASLTVRKTNPNAGFDSVALRFTFPGFGRSAADRIYIQWEKKPGRWGKQWRLSRHKGYVNAKKTFQAGWSKSLAFSIVDKSGKNYFGALPWDKIVQIRLDGKKLTTRPHPKPKVERKPPQPKPAGLAFERSRPAITRMIIPTGVTGRRSPIPLQGGRSIKKLKELEESNKALVQRVIRLELAIGEAKRWFFWGPLAALILSVLFSGTAIFLTYVRLSQNQGWIGAGPARNVRIGHSGDDTTGRIA